MIFNCSPKIAACDFESLEVEGFAIADDAFECDFDAAARDARNARVHCCHFCESAQ